MLIERGREKERVQEEREGNEKRTRQNHTYLAFRLQCRRSFFFSSWRTTSSTYASRIIDDVIESNILLDYNRLIFISIFIFYYSHNKCFRFAVEYWNAIRLKNYEREEEIYNGTDITQLLPIRLAYSVPRAVILSRAACDCAGDGFS